MHGDSAVYEWESPPWCCAWGYPGPRAGRAEQADLLALDGAGWHTTAGLAVPNGLHLAVLPPAAPAPQLAERLWPPSNEAVANCTVASLDAPQEALATRYVTRLHQARMAQRYTGFY